LKDNQPRVFVVVNVFLPDTAGGAAVYTDLCHTLAEKGFTVRVAAPVPFYPEWRDKSERNGLRIWRYDEEGTFVERYGLFIPRDPNSLFQRFLFEFTFFLSLLRALPRMREVDVILAFCPLAAGVAVAGIARWLFGVPVVLNVQDITSEAAASVGIARAAFVTGLLRGVERLLFNQADRWTTISPVMVQRLETLRQRHQPVDYVPNWVGISLAQQIMAAARPKGEVRPHSPIRLLYAGNIGRKQNLISLCSALNITGLDFSLRICGDGAAAASLADWLAIRGDRRFSFEPLLSEREFAIALKWSDYYVITESSGIGGSFFPSKLLPALMSGTPVLAVCDLESPLGVETRAGMLGLHLTWQEVMEVGGRLESVSAKTHAQWVSNAEDRAKAYDRDRLIGKIAWHLRTAVEKGRRRVQDNPSDEGG
jgi:putative colanic acid biosynthesis glycosyltransferase WcaI